MTVRSLTVDGVALSFSDAGEAQGRPPVFCVHGLTRNRRDFDAVVAALRPHRRVLAVDVAGRGASGSLPDPALYANPVYAGQLLKLLDALEIPSVDWIGTSMGGLIGMIVAATAPARVRRLALNDVGPFIPKESLNRIGAYLALPLRWPDLAAAEAHLRRAYAPFGPLSDAEWRHLAETSVRRAPDGGLVPAYDPAIAVPFAGITFEDVNLWPLWAEIRQDVLLLRGAESDLLLRPTALGMVARGRVAFHEFAGVGHAPALLAADQLDAVARWVLAD